MMPILVKGGDVRSTTKAKVQLWLVMGSTGVNGLNSVLNHIYTKYSKIMIQ